MSIKGSSTSQKLGDNRTEFVTVQPQDLALRRALDVHTRFACRVGSQTVARTAGANTGNSDSTVGTVIVDTATPARKGDFVRFVDGLAAGLEIPIESVSTNSFTLGARIETAYLPASGDDFFIMRYTTQRVDENGSQIVTVSQGPTQFVLDGVDTEVSEDTGTPANSIPLPVKLMTATGTPVDFATETTLDAMSDKLPATIGQKASAASLAVALSTEQEAQVGSLTETAPVSDTASSGLNGRLQRIAQRLTSLIALFPSSIGQKAKTGSLSVSLASDDDSLTLFGAVTETAPASDTASSGLNGRLQRVAQRLTSLIALLPSSLGQQVDAASLAVTLSTEGTAQLGSLTETAPVSDTASSGLNGRLQRIAQRVTSLIALLPASLGQKTMSASLAVTVASDQSALTVQQDKSATATLANVSGSASSVTLQSSNTSRKGWMIHNDSTAILYLKFGSTASTTSYTVKLIADAYYELPATSVYTGIITGIWASATGSARVTELT